MAFGLYRSYGRWECRMVLDGSQARTDTSFATRASGSLSTQTADNVSDLTLWADLSASTEYLAADTTGQAEAEIVIPPLGLSGVQSWASWQAQIACLLQVEGLKLYFNTSAGIWRIAWDEINALINGGLVDTVASGSFDGSYFPGIGIPLIGILPDLRAGASFGPAPAVGLVPASNIVGNTQISVDAVVTGGYRFRKAGSSTDVALATELYGIDVPAYAACGEDPDLPTGSSTWSMSTSAHHSLSLITTKTTYTLTECTNGPASVPAVHDVYRTERIVRQEANPLDLIVPAVDCEIVRLNEDYRAEFRRGGLPETLAQSSITVYDEVGEEVYSRVEQQVVHLRQTALLEEVDHIAGTIESPLGFPLLCCYQAAYSYEKGVNYDVDIITAGSCPLVEEGEPAGTIEVTYDATPFYCRAARTKLFGLVEDVTTNPYLLGAIYHSDRIARYLTYNCTPLLSYDLYFPANTIDTDGDTVPDVQTIWKVNDANAPVEYWLTDRQQYGYHPSLPSPSLKRNHVITEPLSIGLLRTLWESLISGCQTSPIGVHNFKLQNAVLENFGLSSAISPAVTLTNCTASYGASAITVTPTLGNTSLVVEIDLGRWTEPPYQASHWWKQIDLELGGANLDSWNAYVVNQAASKALIGSVNGTYNRPDADDTKYAGSWAQNWGQGVLTDLGADLKASGVSSATLADPEKGQVFQLTRGWTNAKLRFEIETVNDTDPVTITYPAFRMAQGRAKVLYEDGQFTAIYHANAPVVRFGQRYWFDGATLQTTPIASTPGVYHMSMLDWLCERRVSFEGVERSDGLDAEIATLFDATEGQTRARCDGGTLAIFLKNQSGDPGADVGNAVARVLLIDSAKEFPPIPQAPCWLRDEDTLEEGVGACDMRVYSLIQGPSRYLSARLAMHIESPGGVRWTTSDAQYTVSGHQATKHDSSVLNNEPYFQIVRDDGEGGDWADARPWRGYTAALGTGQTEPPAGSTMDNCGWIDGSYHAVHIRDADVWYQYARHPLIQPSGFERTLAITSSGDCNHPRVVVNHNGRIYVTYARDSLNTYSTYSDDDGATWSTPEVSITSGIQPDPVTTPDGYLIEAATVGSGPYTIKARIWGPGDQDFGSEITLKDDLGANLSVSEPGFGLAYLPSGVGGINLHCRIDGEPATSHWVCTDYDSGQMTFIRIS